MFRDMAHAGQAAPDFTLPILDGDGQTVTLSQLRDKPVMIEFGSIT
jgi:peroxiredoxin